MTEHALGGGNVAAGVVRVGDTVRKPAGFWTPAVDALLTHLRRAGFTGAPQPLGQDDQGRQVLEYVPGPMAMDQPRLDEAGLHRVGRLIRELHDRSAGFSPPLGSRTTPPGPERSLGPDCTPRATASIGPPRQTTSSATCPPGAGPCGEGGGGPRATMPLARG